MDYRELFEPNKVHHYSERYFFGEVFSISTSSIGSISKILPDSVSELNSLTIQDNEDIIAYHCFFDSHIPYDVIGPNSRIQQRIKQGNPSQFQYDVFFLGMKSDHSGKWYFCVAVPFVRLGVRLFEQIELNASRLGVKYARIDLTKLISDLMASNDVATSKDSSNINDNDEEPEPEIKLKRVDLIYTKNDYIDKTSLRGDDLLSYYGFSSFLDEKLGFKTVLCGINFSKGSTFRPLNIHTDRKGNFKFWVGKSWIRMLTIFKVMEEFEKREMLLPTIDIPSSKLGDINENKDS